MLNQIVLMGRLVRDPELRYTPSQVPVASFRIAVDRDYSGKDGGERQTDFIDITAWRNTGEFVSKYFTKGSMIIVAGRLQLREWTDRETNQKRTSPEVQAERVWFGETKRSRDENAAAGGYRSQGQGYGGYPGGGYAGGGYSAAPQAPAYGAPPQGSAPPPPTYDAPPPNVQPAPQAPAQGQNYGGNYSGFDDIPGESAFSELSDADGELPF